MKVLKSKPLNPLHPLFEALDQDFQLLLSHFQLLPGRGDPLVCKLSLPKTRPASFCSSSCFPTSNVCTPAFLSPPIPFFRVLQWFWSSLDPNPNSSTWHAGYSRIWPQPSTLLPISYHTLGGSHHPDAHPFSALPCLRTRPPSPQADQGSSLQSQSYVPSSQSFSFDSLSLVVHLVI